MKNPALPLLFLTSLFLFPNRTQGQSSAYIPFPDSSATWCAQRSHLNMGPPDELIQFDYLLSMAGDTVINGLTYHKIYESGLEIHTPLPTMFPDTSYYPERYAGCIREDSNKVIYFFHPLGITEGVLLDFNLAVGDTLYFEPYLMVTSIDSVFDGVQYRNRYNISSIDTNTWNTPFYYEHVSLVEGIGSTGGLLWSLGPYFEHWGTLLEFTQNGIVYYQDTLHTCNLVLGQQEDLHALWASVYPVPCGDVLHVALNGKEQKGARLSLSDLAGRVLLEKPLEPHETAVDVHGLKAGIYFYQIRDRRGGVTSGKWMKE